MKKLCPKCSETFICSHSADCWCSSKKISLELSEYLKNKYSDCLCSKCLEELIAIYDEKNQKK